MGDPPTVGFARAARLVAAEARRRGLSVPGFCSPPRVPGADRTLRRRPGGWAMVAVRVRGRPAADVLADLVDGVVRANANRLSEAEAARHRDDLRAAVGLGPRSAAA